MKGESGCYVCSFTIRAYSKPKWPSKWPSSVIWYVTCSGFPVHQSICVTAPVKTASRSTARQGGRQRKACETAMGPDLIPEPPVPGAALAEELDKKLLVQLRDGRKLLGILRSFDQFANLVLEHSIERIIVGDQYADIPLGLQLIRGENVVLLGEVDPEREIPAGLTRVAEHDIKRAQRVEKEERQLKATLR